MNVESCVQEATQLRVAAKVLVGGQACAGVASSVDRSTLVRAVHIVAWRSPTQVTNIFTFSSSESSNAGRKDGRTSVRGVSQDFC